jgi:uncharacterized protein YkwD
MSWVRLRGSVLGVAFGFCALLLAVGGPLSASSAAAADLTIDTRATALLVVEQGLIELTNADRAKNGLPTLDYDPELLWIARSRAAAQLDLDNLSHYDKDGLLAFVKLLDGAGLRYGLAGENLARSGSVTPDLTQRIEEALMKSPKHRENILHPSFSRLAIGAAVDGSTGRIAFAQIFRGD